MARSYTLPTLLQLEAATKARWWSEESSSDSAELADLIESFYHGEEKEMKMEEEEEEAEDAGHSALATLLDESEADPVARRLRSEAERAVGAVGLVHRGHGLKVRVVDWLREQGFDAGMPITISLRFEMRSDRVFVVIRALQVLVGAIRQQSASRTPPLHRRYARWRRVQHAALHTGPRLRGGVRDPPTLRRLRRAAPTVAADVFWDGGDLGADRERDVRGDPGVDEERRHAAAAVAAEAVRRVEVAGRVREAHRRAAAL